MYSKQEKARLTEAFWTALGRYLSPHAGAGGEKVNWINYKTRVRNISFRTMVADGRAIIGIYLTHPEAQARTLAWQQFRDVQPLLEGVTGEQWTWEEQAADDYGQVYSRIFTAQGGANIYRQDDWPALISFFKPRLLALDAFWEQVRFGFEE